MELWDLYNIDRTKVNVTAIRGGKIKSGYFHLVVHACIFNTKGEMLIQQRQSFKEGWPNMWDISVGGSALTNETSQMAIEREVFEEIGLKIDVKNKRPNLTINFDEGFDDYYLLENDYDINRLQLQYEEVQQVQWATIEDIYNKIDKGIFIPYYKSFIQLLFDTRKQYGCHRDN
ncbi:MAG: NUDIX domain-containing protein [Erysipelotrichaceae bacterium]